VRVGFWNFYDGLSRENYCFRNVNAPIGDELLAPFVDLGVIGAANGVEFVTLDVAGDPARLDAILFADFPRRGDPLVEAALSASIPKYLITFECATIKPDNWTHASHAHFDRVFTWHDDLIKLGTKYVKINFAQRFPWTVPRNARERFCALVASNKASTHALELYSARRNAIEWFEATHPGKLDLYGPGWEPRPSARGAVQSKRKMLEEYRFAICYENAHGIPGYITEKIFDCFIAGCVPIYLGAPNILDHVSCIVATYS
jgi:hypothetical protein